MEQPASLPKEIVPYLPLLPIAAAAPFAFVLTTISGGSLFSVDAMLGLPGARFGTMFFMIAVLDFLLVAFIAGKAFGSNGNMQFAPAAYAACELPAVLGFALAFLNKSPALFAPFAIFTALYSAYAFSKSRQRP